MTTKYFDGQDVHLGDAVRLGSDADGVVVALIETQEYSPGFAESEWSYLTRGLLVRFAKYGVIHYENVEPDLVLTRRSTAS